MKSIVTKKQAPISSLFVLKAICAFLVVACHTPMTILPVHIRDIAVPIFFMITGFFLYSEDIQRSIDKSKGYIKKSLLLVLAFSSFYAFLEPLDFTGLLNYKLFIRWLFISIPSRLGGPIWYLVSLFWGLLFFRFYLKLFKGRGIAFLILLMFLGLIQGRYKWLVFGGESSYFVFNFVVQALPTLSIGYLIRKHQARILKFNYIFEIIIVLYLLSIIEQYLLKNYSNGLATIGFGAMTMPLSAGIFVLALQYPQFGKSSYLEKIGKDYSANIYYWHMAFVWLIEVVLLSNIPFYKEIGTIEVFILALLFSIMVVKISKRFGLKLFI